MIIHHSVSAAVAQARIAELVAEANADILDAPRPRRRPTQYVLLAWRRLRGLTPAAVEVSSPVAEPSP